MIAQLCGSLVQIDETSVIIDVAGVGYAVTVSGKTRAGLAVGDLAVTLLTDMHVREDSMTLYGFTDTSERDAFRLLVTVQGVGAKALSAEKYCSASIMLEQGGVEITHDYEVIELSE